MKSLNTKKLTIFLFVDNFGGMGGGGYDYYGGGMNDFYGMDYYGGYGNWGGYGGWGNFRYVSPIFFQKHMYVKV